MTLEDLPGRGIRVRPLTSALVRASEAVRLQEGLLTNDSVTVALMRTMGLTDVATFDADLDYVSPLRVYPPGAIPTRQP
jgi:predicted nucleic acid-binding protein